jgi:Cu2+-exporting ATPase
MAAALASHSRHPAARTLCEAVQATAQLGVCQAMEVQETAGQGLSGMAPRAMRLGSATFCGLADAPSDSSSVFLTDDQGWLATFQLREVLRSDAHRCVQDLEAMGLAVHLLSGDAPGPVALAAAQLGIRPDRAHARCTPDDKLARLRQLQAQGATVAMVGDGLNDAPVLAGAHIAFAFGNASSLAQSQADLVVLGSQLGAITDTLVLARKTMRVVRQNLLWALLYNAACVPLAVAGFLPAWLAGLGMATSSLLVVANAARLALPAWSNTAGQVPHKSKTVYASTAKPSTLAGASS